MEEEKEYLPIDLSKNKCYATVEEMMRDCVSPEIMEEVARLAAASTVSRAMATMRVKAGISREIMAGALGCSLRRISSLEMANNDKIHLPALLKYVEVTGLPFKAVLEDGRTISVSAVPKRRGSQSIRKRSNEWLVAQNKYLQYSSWAILVISIFQHSNKHIST